MRALKECVILLKGEQIRSGDPRTKKSSASQLHIIQNKLNQGRGVSGTRMWSEQINFMIPKLSSTGRWMDRERKGSPYRQKPESHKLYLKKEETKPPQDCIYWKQKEELKTLGQQRLERTGGRRPRPPQRQLLDFNGDQAAIHIRTSPLFLLLYSIIVVSKLFNSWNSSMQRFKCLVYTCKKGLNISKCIIPSMPSPLKSPTATE